MQARKLTNIQMLRAFAAVIVVAFHSLGTAKSYGFGVNAFHFLEGWGACGVDLFFVISGFIMVYTQHFTNKQPFHFFKDRLIRIVPTYWALTLLFIILVFILPSAFRSTETSMLGIVSSLLFFSGLVSSKIPILFVGWSIEFEMLFYLIFSLSLFAKNLTSSIVLASLTLILAILFQHAPLIFFEFIFGMAVGWFYFRFQNFKKYGQLLVAIGSIFFLGGILFQFSEDDRSIMYGIPSVLMVYGSATTTQFNRNLFSRIGDSSYSLYLCQVFVIPAFYKMWNLLKVRALPTDFLFISCVLCNLLIGYLIYIFFEKPVSNYFKNKLMKRSSSVLTI